MPLIEAIKNFKPYFVGESLFIHNWPSEEYLVFHKSEKNVYSLYNHIANKEIIDEFIEYCVPWSESGIHTITNIELYKVKSIEKLL